MTRIMTRLILAKGQVTDRLPHSDDHRELHCWHDDACINDWLAFQTSAQGACPQAKIGDYLVLGSAALDHLIETIARKRTAQRWLRCFPAIRNEQGTEAASLALARAFAETGHSVILETSAWPSENKRAA